MTYKSETRASFTLPKIGLYPGKMGDPSDEGVEQ